MEIQVEGATRSTIALRRIADYPTGYRVKMSRLHWLPDSAYAVDITGSEVKCFSTLADALNYVLLNVKFTENERQALINSLI